MSIASFIAGTFIVLGVFFFTAGSIGLLRFPDALCRLHALTKADNLGLGCVLVGIAIHQADLLVAAKLLMIWLMVLLSSSTACYLVASLVMEEQEDPLADEGASS